MMHMTGQASHRTFPSASAVIALPFVDRIAIYRRPKTISMQILDLSLTVCQASNAGAVAPDTQMLFQAAAFGDHPAFGGSAKS